ncbi:[FeFe] hydrogenase H-cluster maturation GTPase HydF [Alkaliphilus serpentinus]|uniref:[FeFe] hydrogenase H-cluster maturation GTPase HydF n=1 Tax=Alkaliphilus serpentinus TaxID=1482731 RepID=A0A833MAX0_9FIRM|nr:[FeFe] hydrogenase H-cluster maturation GTPase HydF [Alkaliphilus serpentinus]KAB3533529.1 [FeFe] hydrogenase H-cluster maturation GTPase HydF [Alkaliphilus serpentinus]
MNQTPRGNRLHIAIFGRRNAGKSSLINALTNQDIALVSEVAGTTTDPVYKAMEILPIGPVLIIDTAGIDDEGIVGNLRIQKTKEVLNKTDVAIIVTDPQIAIGNFEEELIAIMKERKIPTIIAVNKIDLVNTNDKEIHYAGLPTISLSAKYKEGIEELKRLIIDVAPSTAEKPLLDTLVEKGDMIVLVTPIDSSAPKGRMILPQVQVIRAILDADAVMTVCKETQLEETLSHLKNGPKLVITDSQAFKEVNEKLPKDIPLTSFSIIYANHKGDLKTLVEGTNGIRKLRDGAKVLIAEGCSHHRQDEDIGTVKIPKWLEQISGKKLDFQWVQGTAFPDNLEGFDLVVHCGSCMQNRKEMLYRIGVAERAGVPIVNYGVLISYVNGILDRTIAPFLKKG